MPCHSYWHGGRGQRHRGLATRAGARHRPQGLRPLRHQLTPREDADARHIGARLRDLFSWPATFRIAMASTAKKRLPRNVPQRIGKYEIVREVGEGSTGTVYLSHDPYYGRDVAIKLYYDDFGGDEDKARAARKMFLSEAHMVGMLQHPQLMPIYDAGEE